VVAPSGLEPETY